MTKQYLGNSVYINTDGYSIELTNEDDIEIYNSIIIDPNILMGLISYAERNNIIMGQRIMTKQQQQSEDIPDGTQAHRHKKGRWLGIHVDVQGVKNYDRR